MSGTFYRWVDDVDTPFNPSTKIQQLDLDLAPPPPSSRDWRQIDPDTDFDHGTHDWRELPDGSIWIRPASGPAQ
jgi:hypothetical protein